MKPKNVNSNTSAGGNDIDIAITFTCDADMLTNSFLIYEFGVNYSSSPEYLNIGKLRKELRQLLQVFMDLKKKINFC